MSYKANVRAGPVCDLGDQPLIHRQGQEPQSIGLERRTAKCQSEPVANGAELVD